MKKKSEETILALAAAGRNIRNAVESNMVQKEALEKDRASGIIVRNGKILLIHRIRDNKEYWVFPGGSIEDGESKEQALDRELMEELQIETKEKEFILELENIGRTEYYFLINSYEGTPKIGGPELERMNKSNQYILEEKDRTELLEIKLLPDGIADKIIRFLAKEIDGNNIIGK